jgi:hypothetical protein
MIHNLDIRKYEKRLVSINDYLSCKLLKLKKNSFISFHSEMRRKREEHNYSHPCVKYITTRITDQRETRKEQRCRRFKFLAIDVTPLFCVCMCKRTAIIFFSASQLIFARVLYFFSLFIGRIMSKC